MLTIDFDDICQKYSKYCRIELLPTNFLCDVYKLSIKNLILIDLPKRCVNKTA